MTGGRGKGRLRSSIPFSRKLSLLTLGGQGSRPRCGNVLAHRRAPGACMQNIYCLMYDCVNSPAGYTSQSLLPLGVSSPPLAVRQRVMERLRVPESTLTIAAICTAI